MNSRVNELTAVLNRGKFDEPPGDIRGEADHERWLEFRRKYHKSQSLSAIHAFPIQIDFELTYSCNMRCKFCPHGNPESPQPTRGESLPIEFFRKAIDEGEQHGLCSIKMNYINEPLMSKDLVDCIKYAKAHGVLNVYFATNGSLLSESVSRDLISAGASKIMVSIDAFTSETYKAVRRNDKFAQVVSNVKRLVEIKKELGIKWPLVRVNFVKTPANISELDSFVNYWKDLADMIGLEQQVGLPGVDNAEFLDQVSEDFRCSFPFKLVVIDSEGSILPCCTFSGREMPLGNIKHMTIEEAWNSERMVALRCSHLNNTWQSNKICYHCVKA